MTCHTIAINQPKEEEEEKDQEVERQRRRRKVIVSFNPSVICVETLHVCDYTDAEIASTWFTLQEYKSIKQENKLTLSLIENGANFATQSDIFTARGLEGFVSNPIIRHPHHRFSAIDAVLDEQDVQDRCGISNQLFLAKVYGQYSFTSTMEARILAIADEKTVLDFDKETTMMNAGEDVQQQVRSSTMVTTSQDVRVEDSASLSSSNCGCGESILPFSFRSNKGSSSTKKSGIISSRRRKSWPSLALKFKMLRS